METKIVCNTSEENVMGTSLPAECGDDDIGVQDYFRDHATASSTSASVEGMGLLKILAHFP